MGRQGRWFVTVVVMVMVTGRVVTELQCGVECVCQEEKKAYLHNYNVVCNATTLHEATLTEQLLSGMSNFSTISTPRTSVRVEGGQSLTLTITLDFLLQWRQFSVCILDVIGAGNVVFPAIIPPFIANKPLEHYYAGMTLTNVTLSEVPANIFSGKAAAALSLNNTTVGRLTAGVLKGMISLGKLSILNSTVGVMEGLQGGPAVNTKNHLGKKIPVLLANSTVGLLSSGALHLKAQQDQKIVLQGLTIGRVDYGAVEVEGGKVVVEQCVATQVEAGALLLGEDTHLSLRNNWLVLQPDALTHLQCDQDEHQVYDNHFSVQDTDTAFPVSLTMQHGEGDGKEEEEQKRKIAERKRLADILTTVIHPSCVSYNLAPLPSMPSWPSASPGQLATFGVIGLFIGLIVACLALLSFQHYRRRRRQHHVKPPTMVMSQLSNEEPSLTPPEIPPFPKNLCRPTQNSSSCCTPDPFWSEVRGLGRD